MNICTSTHAKLSDELGVEVGSRLALVSTQLNGSLAPIAGRPLWQVILLDGASLVVLEPVLRDVDQLYSRSRRESSCWYVYKGKYKEDDRVACQTGFRPVHFRNSRRTVSLQFLAFVYAASGLVSKCPAFWLRPFLDMIQL